MKSKTSRAATNSLPFINSIIAITLITVCAALSVKAQGSTDGTTPLGLTPGSPSGTYPLSDFDVVNLFNGTLNFRLPVYQIAGRGGAAYPITLQIEKKWTVNRHFEPGIGYFYYADGAWWSESGTAWFLDVGRVEIRTGYREQPAGSPVEGLTRVTFTAPDGTEYEFRDQLTNGQPKAPVSGGFNRGTVFLTADGTTATFISDWDILETAYGMGPPPADGYVRLKDGTHFRVDDGAVTWMRDRNGNKVTFGKDAFSRVTSITDSLNRLVSITYPSSTTGFTQISFKGYGGASRTIKVGQTNLANALRSGYTMQTAAQLFPEMHGVWNLDAKVINYIELPDGRSYQLRYNPYGELARVVLPTGGAIEYDYAAGLTDGASSGAFSHSFPPTEKYVYRRVTERRIYPDGGSGSSYESKMTYSRPETTTTNDGYVITEQRNASGTLLAKSQHYFHGSARASFLMRPTHYPAWKDGREYKTEVFDIDGTTILRRTERTFAQRAAVSWWGGTADTAPPNDPRLTETITTIEPATANLVTKRTFGYDDTVPFNNQNNVKEYNFGTGSAGSLARETRSTFVTSSSYTDNTVHLRGLLSQVSIYDGGGTERARTVYEYDNYLTDTNHAALTNRSNISGLDSAFTTSYNTRGNVTASTRHLFNTSGVSTGSVSGYHQYDIAGNVVKAIDARGYATVFDFDDRFGAPDGNAQANSGSTELGSQVSYAFATKVTNPLLHIAYSQFDYYLSRPVDTEDPNGTISSGYFNDPLDRPTQVRRAVQAGGPTTQMTFSYDDVNRVITTTGDLYSFNDNVLVTKTLYDGFGRIIEARQYEGGTNYIATQTQYDAFGRPFKTSNPFRPWQSQTAVWTTQAFDALGRVVSVTTPDNAAVITAYSGNSVTVTDPAGKRRKSVTDALGRLIDVYEDPAIPGGPVELDYQTSYTYDVLDNLVKVVQGTQQRFFMYDSLKRLIRSRIPEQATYATLDLSDPLTGNSTWSVGYQYDAAGNITQKTDPRGVVSTYAYDALNRNTTIDYSDTASINPDIKRFYDGATNGKGRSWYNYAGGDASVGSNVEHTSIDSYDSLGRPLVQRQVFKLNGTWSGMYQTTRTYNAAGGVSTQTYPSGHTVTYNYDSAGRVADKDEWNLAFTGNLGDGVQRTYSSGTAYSEWGSLFMEKFGTQTPLYHKLQYNIRGQLCDVRVATGSDVNGSWNRGALQFFYESTLTHCASGPDNNGNVLKASHYVPDDQQNALAIPHQLYTYDSLNRLTSAAEYFISDFQPLTQTSLQSYSYDRWGNRTINAAQTWGTGINNKQFTVDPNNTNRLVVPSGQSGVMSYDSVGNLTNDTYTGAGTRTYDAENRMTTAADNTGQTSRYTYDADGKRTRRQVSGGQEQWQIYGFDGELLAEYRANFPASSPEKEYGYRNGRLLITATPSMSGNHSLSVNGSNAYVQVPNSTSLNITGSITVEAWIKPGSIGSYQYIASRETYGVSGTGGGYELTLNNVGKARFDLYHSHNTYTPVIGSTTLTTGQWHHVAGVWDGSYLRIYVNGVLDGTVTTGNGPASGTSSLKLGRNSGGGYFNGLIDEVRVSNTALYSSNFTPQTSLTATGSTKGLWKFNGSSVADSSTNGNNGSLQGGATYSTDVPIGPAYHSLSVNGTNAYVQVPNSTSLNITGAITVEAWIKPNSIGAYQYIASRETYGVSGTGGGYELTLNNVGKARFDLYHSHNTYTPVIGTTTLTTGQWHHVAGVWDGSYLRIYVDGVLDGTVTTGNGPASGTSSLKLGRNSGGGYFNGLIDEVRVSNTAVYSSNFTPQTHLSTTANTKGLWKFDGQVATDSSTNGNNGTLQGGATYSNDVPSGDGGGGGGGGTPAQTLWLVPDHLGTPRIIVDQTGNLAGVKRHDYLPFGEELFAGTGGRTVAMGYVADGIRQQFTSKERDVETSLDYFAARYYSATQGRFTSADTIVGSPANPQSSNLYSYVQNNPLRYIDPTGHVPVSLDQIPPGCFNCQDQKQPENQQGHEKKPASILPPDNQVPDEVLVINSEPAFKSNANAGANDGLTDTGIAFSISGFAATGSEYYYVFDDRWRGVNGKTYPMRWGGNQYTRGRSLAVAKAGVFRVASRAFFFTGATISASQGYQNIQDGNYAGAAKNGLDIGMSAAATFGGPYGVAIGGTYFIGDTVGWKETFGTHTNNMQEVEKITGMGYSRYMGPIY